MNPHRIDLHHHVFPPRIVDAMKARNINWTGHSEQPAFDLSRSLELMERYSIASAVVSFQPQIYWGNIADTIAWAREGNEYIANVVRNDPAHFGGFASMPLPDTDAALRELEYALDTLKLDGVFLTTSQDGRYPGDPLFEDFFHELNRRKAVVLFHPNPMPPGSNAPKLGFPASLMEFPFDTTRAVASLLFSGTLERYPSIRFILPHAGGTVPYLSWRIASAEGFVPRMRQAVPQGTMTYLRRLYYETAIAAAPAVQAALKQVVPVSQIVFGSDNPFAPEPLIKAMVADLENSTVFNADERRAIDRENALALFPRFAQVPVGV